LEKSRTLSHHFEACRPYATFVTYLHLESVFFDDFDEKYAFFLVSSSFSIIRKKVIVFLHLQRIYQS
jgi:hypothetical protein